MAVEYCDSVRRFGAAGSQGVLRPDCVCPLANAFVGAAGNATLSHLIKTVDLQVRGHNRRHVLGPSLPCRCRTLRRAVQCTAAVSDSVHCPLSIWFIDARSVQKLIRRGGTTTLTSFTRAAAAGPRSGLPGLLRGPRRKLRAARGRQGGTLQGAQVREGRLPALRHHGRQEPGGAGGAAASGRWQQAQAAPPQGFRV